MGAGNLSSISRAIAPCTESFTFCMPNGKTEKARAQVKPMQRTANDWITEGRLDVNKMRAMVVTSPGAGLHMEEREIPEPGAGEVRIRVHACGVCHGDAFIVEGKRPNLTYPRIPGHEVIGEIEAIAPGIAGWAIGERIGVGWFAGACGRCTPCRKGQAFACRTMRGATGLTRDGGYATHMLADVSAIARVPVELESVAAAPLLCAGVTTFNALRHCQACDRVHYQQHLCALIAKELRDSERDETRAHT